MQKIQFEDKLLSWIIVVTMLLLLFRVTILMQLFDETHFLVTGYKYVVVVLFFLGLKTILKRSMFFTVKAYLLFSFVYVLQVSLFPENKELIDKDIFYTMVVCVPMMVYIYSIKDYEIFYDSLRKAIPIVLVFSFVYCYMILVDGMIGKSNVYNMSAGFSIMTFALVAFGHYFYERKFLYFIWGILLSFAIVLIGSRGPVLWIAVYVGWKLVSKSSFVLRIVLCTLLGVFIFFFGDIIILINDLLASFGVYSRTTQLLEVGLTEGSGRWELYEQGIQIIVDNWLIGAGLGCDRAIHSYIHNIFLEIWMDYGIIVGTMLMVFFFLSLYNAIKKSGGQQRVCLELFIFIGFAPLLLSGSYYIDFRFFILVGIILGVLRSKDLVKNI